MAENGRQEWFGTAYGPVSKSTHCSSLRKRALESVVQLAVELAREGREGRKVGTLFVIGDIDNVLARSRPLLLDLFTGIPPTFCAPSGLTFARPSRSCRSWTAPSSSPTTARSSPPAATSTWISRPRTSCLGWERGTPPLLRSAVRQKQLPSRSRRVRSCASSPVARSEPRSFRSSSSCPATGSSRALPRSGRSRSSATRTPSLENPPESSSHDSPRVEGGPHLESKAER